MRIFRWALVGAAALMLGLGFALLSGSVFLAAVPTVGVILIAAYLSWEERSTHQPGRGANRGSRASAGTVHAATYGGTFDGGASGGDCGFGGDGGGSFGVDGGGAGGC